MRGNQAFRLRWVCRSLLAFFLLAGSVPQRSMAYSVLTHEQIIDLAWKESIRPVLLARYPGLTDTQLVRAHAFAYGGCAIQDIGYYPFGHEFFSDLTHYVRTGDFVIHLLRDARTADEFAFALGALSHYVGDTLGHELATNPATAIEFPKLEHKYGPTVTYDQAPHAHVRTEFAFDIDQLSFHRLAPAAYLRHVGLGVPRALLERAFYETYGLSLHSVLGNERPAIRSYRTSVRSLIPRVAHAENIIHGKSFPQDAPTDSFRIYQDRLQAADFASTWNAYRRSPGFTTHLLALLIRIVPKIGSLSILAIRGPNEDTEELYTRSFNRTMEKYDGLLGQLRDQPLNQFTLPDLDLDTGYPVRPGSYALTDQTYAKLLHRLTAKPRQAIPDGLKRNILAYYADPNAPISTKQDADAWRQVERELPILRSMRVSNHVPDDAKEQED